jgi:hypothetical protein
LIPIFVANAEDRPSLAIIPFLVEPKGICPLCKGVFQKGKISSGSEDILTRVLYEKIESKGIFKTVPAQKVSEIVSRFDKKDFKENPFNLLIKIGRELNTDFVLIGFLFRFEERIGSSIGVERPASVGFDLHLIRLRDGVEVWMGRFDETQRPLSENLFKIGSFFRRRASWLTAEELSKVGMDELLKGIELKELEEK